MKKKITEQSILFFSIFKWFILASLMGVIVGLGTTLFIKLLNLSIGFGARYSFTFYFLPLAFFLSAVLTKYLAPDAEGHGTEKVIEAVHRRSGKINPAVAPVKLAATIITIAAGGSAGKEGPCAQIGAALASLFASLFRFDDHDRRKLVVCGISAGFASVFGTPISGAIFGMEVLFVGSILYDLMLPCFIAGIVSYQVSWHLGITYFYHTFSFIPVFSELFFIKVVLSGIFFGLCSFILIEFLSLGKKLSQKIKIWLPLKGIIGGAMLVILTLLFSKMYLGLGLDTIGSALNGKTLNWYDFILKIIFTTVTLNFCGSGGIITPIFFIGAAAGNLFARMWGFDISTFSAIGMVSLLAGATNTPLAASIMAVELFGPAIAPYAAVACIISFLMTGHRSVYPSQILSFRKSASLDVEIGHEIKEIKTLFSPRKKSLAGFILNLKQYLTKKRAKK